MLFRGLVLIVLAMLAWRGEAAAPVTDKVVQYRVQQGDNLFTLAQGHFVRVGDFRLVQRLNRISNPYRLSVGTILRIPQPLLRHEPLAARIVAYRGTVRVASRRGARAAALDMIVGEGDQLTTGSNSFVSLRLPDDSVVALPSQSRVEIRRLRKWSLTQGVDRLFAIVKGRARTVVTPAKNADDDFRFSTPVAVSAVRGTEFRVSFDDVAGRATTEVLEGSVSVEAGKQAPATVQAGFGAVSTAEGRSEALPLLAAPTLERPGRVQDETQLNFEMRPVAGAARYHVQVAQDAGFLDVVSETYSDQPRAELPAVPDGTWFVRLSAVDPNGLEGLQETYSFHRRLNRIEASLDTSQAGGYRQYLFRWQVEGEGKRQYRFQMKRGSEDAPAIIDEPGLTAQRFIVTDLPPGTYFWRVQTLQFVDGDAHAKWSAFQRLTIASDE